MVFLIHLHITDKCNLRCAYCKINEQNNKNINYTKKEIIGSINKIIPVIKNKKIIVGITGGEPFILGKKLFDLIEDIKRLLCRNSIDNKISILTNGTLITQDEVKMIKQRDIDYIEIGLDGLENTHNELKRSDCFKKAVNSIELLNKNKIKVMINSILLDNNINEIEPFYMFLQTLKIRSVNFNPYIMLKSKDIKIKTNDKELKIALKNIKNLERSYPKKILSIQQEDKKQNGLVIFSKERIYPCYWRRMHRY